ncbi:hypothetical protein EHS25_001713 [Saitozyma podzolica]|uniref:Uncharacterized protein n=1 Tax=Saitozyma podzolica TaxID=1890683 RepID=A0A427YF64_9TREE|nr:hypothetical protein EHS25_001713 [Saitozyma podzolica]
MLTSPPEYVNNLEKSLRVREEECTALRNQVDAQRDEIDDLRQRLSLPLVPPPDTALGLVVPNSEWQEGIPKDDRKEEKPVSPILGSVSNPQGKVFPRYAMEPLQQAREAAPAFDANACNSAFENWLAATSPGDKPAPTVA